MIKVEGQILCPGSGPFVLVEWCRGAGNWPYLDRWELQWEEIKQCKASGTYAPCLQPPQDREHVRGWSERRREHNTAQGTKPVVSYRSPRLLYLKSGFRQRRGESGVESLSAHLPGKWQVFSLLFKPSNYKLSAWVWFSKYSVFPKANVFS